MSSKNNTKHKHAPHVKKTKDANSVFTVDKRLVRNLSIVLILFSFFLYLNTLNHGYVLDDHSVIRENSLTKGGTASIGKIFKSAYRDGFGSNGNDLYRPLSKVMFAIEWQYSPNNAKTGHFVNIVLYSLICFLLFIVLIKYIKINTYILFIATLLFAAHPIHTEVVANIKSRDEILAMIFLLLSLLFISKYIATNKTISFIGALVCFFLALLSKESAIVFVGIVFIMLHFFGENKNLELEPLLARSPLIRILSLHKKNSLLTSAFAAVGLIYIFIHVQIIGNLGIPNVPIVDNSIMGTAEGLSTFMEQKLTAIHILGKYLLLLFFPHPLSCDYSYNTIPLVRSAAHLGFLVSFLIHGALLFYAIIKFKSKNLLAFCILFYLISISITSNVFMTIGTNMAERLLFFPSVGFCLAIAILGAKAFKINFNSSIAKLKELSKTTKIIPLLTITIVISLLYSFKTYNRNKDWKSDGTLFNTDVEKVPESAHMLFYTANHLMNKDSLRILFNDKIAAAKTDIEKQAAIEAKNKYIAKADKLINKALKIYELFPDAHNVAGRTYYERNQFDMALKHYSRALELNPSETSNLNNIGSCYFNTGKVNEALSYYQKAVANNPKDADAHCNLGSAYGTLGESYKKSNDMANATQMFKLAIDNFNKTIAIDPNYRSAYQFLGFTYANLGDTTQSKKYLDAFSQMK